MLTISLDEQGDFENMTNNNAPIFIGGIIYNDLDLENERDNEKKRINAYLESVCTSVGENYPGDLHVRSYPGGGNNSAAVRKVKIKLGETLTEFFTKGTFGGEALLKDSRGDAIIRKGRYHFFIMLKSIEGKKNLLGNHVSELIKDDYAGNLYVHMAEDIVSRIIFHNPIITDMGKIRVELATRRIVLEGADRNVELAKYLKIGYKEDTEHSTPKSRVVLLTNVDNYRTTLEREMLETNKNNIVIDRISVKSIHYAHRTNNMEFLYLSDILCSVLGFEPKGDKPKEWLKEFSEDIEGYTGHKEHLIFAYDSIDNYYKRAYKCYEEKDYYGALSIAFEAGRIPGEFTEFYGKVWFRQLRKKIGEECDLSAYVIAVRKFQASVLNNNVNQEKLIYIYNTLAVIKDNISFERKDEQVVLYDLYDTAVAAFCHVGDVKRARECYTECKKYARYVGIERYLRTRNKVVVMLSDALLFDEALAIARENIEYHKQFLIMRKEIFKDDALDDSLGYAIALSQLGQIQASLRMPEARESFMEALNGMDKDSANYLITQSYLLHHYIDMGDKTAYEELSIEYFGCNTDLEKQFEYIVSEGKKEKNARFSLKFAMYLYIKGIYTFYMDEVSNRLINKLLDIEKSIKKISSIALKQINGHPWELIFKYIALIAIKKGKTENLDSYRYNTSSTIDTEGLIINVMENFGLAQIADALGDIKARDEYAGKALMDICHENDRIEPVKKSEAYDKLDKIITYMYR